MVAAVARGLARRLTADDRERKVLAALAALFVAGASLRALLLLADRPGFLGYADSYSYIAAAKDELFGDPLRPAGYPAFLRLVHAVRPDLSVAALAQALLGITAAGLLYLAARRAQVGR